MDSGHSKFWKFLPRIFKFRHLEFDSALQQMFWALVYPKRVYRYHQNRYELKGQMARDDPAFLLLLVLFLSLCVLLYSIWLSLHPRFFFLSLLWVVLGDCIGVGLAVASLLWLVSNNFLIRKSALKSPRVEWAYCFDVHLNAFLPLSLWIYGIQGLFFPLLFKSHWILVSLLTNTLWVCAVSYYVYTTFLGYATLSFTRNAVGVLYAIIPLVLLYILAIPFGWNFTTAFGSFYSWRAGS